MTTHDGDGATVMPALAPEPRFALGAPPLPDALVEGQDASAPVDEDERPGQPLGAVPALVPRKALRGGCYLLRYTPTPPAVVIAPQHYDGTMRVERAGGILRASGDLYAHPRSPCPTPIRRQEPDPAAGIPIFARSRYRYYVRVTRISRSLLPARYRLGFELHRFTAASGTFAVQGAFTADMRYSAAPGGFPSPGDYLRGEVKDAAGAVVGELTMGWVSKYLRKAVVEVDRVAPSEPALANAAGLDWAGIFEQVGWQVTVDQSDSNLVEPSGASWSDAEMHAALLARRDSANLDAEWRYWLLCVRRLDSTERGIMFDAGAGDTNAIPREGAGISSHWVIPNADPWGLVKGMRFGAATDPYFRTAVHELGHAMGLYHNTVDNGFMHTTPDIAASAVAPQQFPANIQWSHAPDDQHRLRHMPDVWVRPGGLAFGAAYSTAPIVADDAVAEAEGLRVAVAPLMRAVPIGAPVRVDVALVNGRGDTVPVPRSLSLKGGHVSGRVIDPSGAVRSFRPLLRCVEHDEHADLGAGEALESSLTLLRGAEGALFPTPGIHRVEVDVDWEVDGAAVRATGATNVLVTGVVDEAHADAALQILATPDALLTLALGGDHLPEGIAAIDAALGSDTLRPHYAWPEAKRIARPFFDRQGDPEAAAALVGADTIMSAAEARKAAELGLDAHR